MKNLIGLEGLRKILTMIIDELSQYVRRDQFVTIQLTTSGSVSLSSNKTVEFFNCIPEGYEFFAIESFDIDTSNMYLYSIKCTNERDVVCSIKNTSITRTNYNLAINIKCIEKSSGESTTPANTINVASHDEE